MVGLTREIPKGFSREHSQPHASDSNGDDYKVTMPGVAKRVEGVHERDGFLAGSVPPDEVAKEKAGDETKEDEVGSESEGF